ncbi:hypothetical protein ACVWXQ_009623 [Bradyrhizobium sp. S3.14.4]
MGRVDIDLHDLCLVRVELPPGKVGAQHQQRITIQQGMIPGLVAEHPGHSNVVGIVKLEEVLCARRMRDRRLQPVGDRENFLMGSFTARSAIHDNIFAAVEDIRDLVDIRIARSRDGSGDVHRIGDVIIHDRGGDIRRYDQDSNTAFRQSRLAGDHRFPARLFRGMDHIAEDATVSVDLLEVDLLDEFEAKFVANDLTCDQDDGCTVAIGFEYPVDEMQASGTTTAGNSGQAICDLRLRLRGERPRLLVSHRYPLDLAFFERAGDQIEGVADDAVTMLDACALQGLHNDIRDQLAHDIQPWL